MKVERHISDRSELQATMAEVCTIYSHCLTFLKLYLLIIPLDDYIYNTTKKHFNNRH